MELKDKNLAGIYIKYYIRKVTIYKIYFADAQVKGYDYSTVL